MTAGSLRDATDVGIAEHRIGHLQHYETRSGRVLKLARRADSLMHEVRPPREAPTQVQEPFWKVLGVGLLLVVALYVLSLAIAAYQAVPA